MNGRLTPATDSGEGGGQVAGGYEGVREGAIAIHHTVEGDATAGKVFNAINWYSSLGSKHWS